jgi:hypothetical protein
VPSFSVRNETANHFETGVIVDMNGPLMKIDGEGEFEFEIVGESHYQDALNRIAGPKTEEGVEWYCEAELRPEPSNPHDINAVAVMIHGLKVGYLAREDAMAWNRALANTGRPDAPTLVDAVIVGGWQRPDGREGSFGVKLDL